ncbi:Uncharacterised protein [Mycobacteroides abscessus subsp. abscessus]|nr:Uncharacterised protein [Mycobacteroides abscessus subsp. abscessus]
MSIFIAYIGSLIILATTSEDDPHVVPSGCTSTPGWFLAYSTGSSSRTC